MSGFARQSQFVYGGRLEYAPDRIEPAQERYSMSAISDCKREPDDPDRATQSHLPDTLPFTHGACDELRRYVERQLQLAIPGGVFNACIRALERELLEAAIRIAEGNQSKASRRLGISRPAFRDKLAKHGLLKQHGAPPH